MELQWNSSPLLSKILGMIYFGVFFICLSGILYAFAQTISVMGSSHLFLEIVMFYILSLTS